MAFIVFEGLDGSGKSTLMRGLCDHLTKSKIDYHVTREPGGTDLGEELRSIILRTEGDTPTPRTELLLYQAIRAQHVDNIISPKLKQGKWVLSDRFTASTYAFQVGGRGLDREEVEWLNRFATHGIMPELWVLLDLPITESAKRMQSRVASGGEELDRFEQEKASFHEKVRQSYLEMAKADPEKWLVLDACLGPEELLQELLQSLRSRAWLEF